MQSGAEPAASSIPAPPDARSLFDHVDAALPLVAQAAGLLGTAGGAAVGGSDSPFELLDGVVKVRDQRKARRALELARPHLQAIVRLGADAEAWIQHGAELEVGSARSIWIDIVTTGNLLGGWFDVHAHNRIETQRLELGGVLESLGRLHGRLRAEYGFTGVAAGTAAPVPDVRNRRGAWSIGLWLAWCLLVVGFLWYQLTR